MTQQKPPVLRRVPLGGCVSIALDFSSGIARFLSSGFHDGNALLSSIHVPVTSDDRRAGGTLITCAGLAGS